jgi:hypothetical protein
MLWKVAAPVKKNYGTSIKACIGPKTIRYKIWLRWGTERADNFASSHLRSELRVDLQKQDGFGLAASSPKL